MTIKASGWNRITRGPFICRHCGKSYTTNRPKGQGEIYCSRECSFAHKHELSQHRKSRIESERTKPVVCRVCGVTFHRYASRTWCSDECRKREASLKSLKRNKENKTTSQYTCSVCGVVFIPEYGNKRKKFCSDRCSNKHLKSINKNRKRAKHFKVTYEPVLVTKVFDRDSWVCQICGINTPKNLRGSIKQNAPELDHIIPISRGGSHTYSNVQCACRRCNALKSNKTSAGQMRLFG